MPRLQQRQSEPRPLQAAQLGVCTLLRTPDNSYQESANQTCGRANRENEGSASGLDSGGPQRRYYPGLREKSKTNCTARCREQRGIRRNEKGEVDLSYEEQYLLANLIFNGGL